MVERIVRITSIRGATAITFATICALLAWWTPLDGTGDQYTSEGLHRALTTFAAARGIEAVISLFQSASVSTTFVVAGMSVQPAAVLAPARELVERFSTVVLLACASFAMQQLVLTVMKSAVVATVTSVVCALWLLSWYFRSWTTHVLGRVMVALVVLRLFVPLAGGVSMEIHNRALASEYARSDAVLQQLSPDPPAAVGTILERIKQRFGGAMDIASKVEEVKARVGALSEHMVRLAAIFLLETVALPIAWLACAVSAARGLDRWLRDALTSSPGPTDPRTARYPVRDERIFDESRI